MSSLATYEAKCNISSCHITVRATCVPRHETERMLALHLSPPSYFSAPVYTCTRFYNSGSGKAVIRLLVDTSYADCEICRYICRECAFNLNIEHDSNASSFASIVVASMHIYNHTIYSINNRKYIMLCITKTVERY